MSRSILSRYLASGGESSSLYLQVQEVKGTEVICVAQNESVLEGLLCVFHAERSRGDGLSNVQNELPILCEWDKHCIQVMTFIKLWGLPSTIGFPTLLL